MEAIKIAAVVLFFVAVGCDGVVGSDAKVDKCGKCAGDDTSCHIISGIFTRRSLPSGYSLVTTIPNSACNVNITELYPSRNYLALKLAKGGRYIINGHAALGFSNDYEGAGTVFTYNHPGTNNKGGSNRKQSILAKGPLSESVDIMLLKQEENKGVMYSYTIPSGEGDADGDKHHGKHHGGHHGGHHHKKQQPAAEDKTTAVDPDGLQQDQRQHSDRYRAYLQRIRAQRAQSERQNVPQTDNRRRVVQPSLPQTDNRRRVVQPSLPQTDNRRRVVQPSLPQTDNRRRVVQPGQPVQPIRTVDSYNPQYARGTNRRQPVLQQPPASYPIQPQPNPVVPNPGYPQYPNQRGVYPPNYQRGGSVYPPQAQSGRGQYVLPLQGGTGGVGQGYGYQRQQPVYLPAQGATDYQAQRGSVAYLPPSYANQRQESTLGQTRYSGYTSGSQNQPYRGTVNDQIAVNLPSESRLRIGEPLDSSAPFSWKISGFSECTRTCGGGLQTTVIVCVKTDSRAVVTDENCDNALKPKSQSVACNNSPCGPDWDMTEWTQCSTSCGVGQQKRVVECKQRISEAVQVRVSANQCQNKRKPVTIQRCNQDKPCIRWKIGEWSKCSVECGRGQKSRDIVCVDAREIAIAENNCLPPKPNKVEICDMGSCAKTWYHTDWSEECSGGCGQGYHTRRTFCSADQEKCAKTTRPKERKPCKNDLPCGGVWFTGPWGECTVTCGSGVIQRDVACMKKLGPVMAVVSDGNCLHQEEPEKEKPCYKAPCQAEWYMSDWTQCSKSCGTGVQTREVKCLDPFQRVTSACDQTEKPQTRQTCNKHKCLPRNSLPGNQDQPDASYSSCSDKLDNCQLVARAPKLCRYDYYKKVCCKSCQSSLHHHHHHRHHRQGS